VAHFAVPRIRAFDRISRAFGWRPHCTVGRSWGEQGASNSPLSCSWRVRVVAAQPRSRPMNRYPPTRTRLGTKRWLHPILKRHRNNRRRHDLLQLHLGAPLSRVRRALRPCHRVTRRPRLGETRRALRRTSSSISRRANRNAISRGFLSAARGSGSSRARELVVCGWVVRPKTRCTTALHRNTANTRRGVLLHR
jgi:hypothetical protein